MLNFVDDALNRILMYKLILWYLRILVAIAIALSFAQVLPFKPWDLIFEVLVLVSACWAFNQAFAKILKAPSNIESQYITGLILTLIVTPQFSLRAFWLYLLLAFASQASKYILTFKRKHIFNPAAFAVTVTFFTINQGASWWVGNINLVWFVLIGGLLIIRKVRRWDLFLSFLITFLAVTNVNPKITLLYSPILYFASVMLTEPSTTPPTATKRIACAILTGLLLWPKLQFDSFYITPELALLAGNIFSFMISPKGKFIMTFRSKTLIASTTFDLTFAPNDRVRFEPGQYLEWTVPHKMPDFRGNRRYFTIASSPTESEVHLGIKFYENPSSFKKALTSLSSGDKVLSGQIAGDFTLPKDKQKKLAFIAGGIGITPFRSMIKFLLDKNEKRDIVLFYSCKTEDEVSYREILDAAQSYLGIKVVYVITDKAGFLNVNMITGELPDYGERKFYISGPRNMVEAFKKTLRSMGVSYFQIKSDFFPGYV